MRPASPLQTLLAQARRWQENRQLRFLLAGALNTLFGFLVYGAAVLAGVEVWLALLVSMLAGTAFNFFTTGGYVFRDLALARLPRFLTAYFSIYAVNLGLFELLSRWLQDKLLIQAVLLVPMALLAYTVMNRFVFANKSGAQ